MGVENRLDFLGVHFLSANIDDAIAAPNNVVAAVAPFDMIAGFNEPILVGDFM